MWYAITIIALALFWLLTETDEMRVRLPVGITPVSIPTLEPSSLSLNIRGLISVVIGIVAFVTIDNLIKDLLYKQNKEIPEVYEYYIRYRDSLLQTLRRRTRKGKHVPYVLIQAVGYRIRMYQRMESEVEYAIEEG